MKEYEKIVQIKKLKMKLTFSLDVQNLVRREMIFSILYQLKLKILIGVSTSFYKKSMSGCVQFTNGFSIFSFPG
jgi:hypothetical protein